MKYMGSKRWMLENGLGHLLLKESQKSKRVVDLFCGSGSVASFIAQKTKLPVLAVDLQSYSIVLVKAIIGRSEILNEKSLIENWITPVMKERGSLAQWVDADKQIKGLDRRKTREYVENSRKLCKEELNIGPIWSAYGGHYFSPKQAITFDYLIKHLPQDGVQRVVCQSAMISAASRCAASPGHTAQPFQPTRSAAKFILESWSKDPAEICKKILEEICPKHAHTIGKAYVGDAVEEASKFNKGDLVFVDPPYSGVHYSRFYHVLETLAKGYSGPVSGVGRYPAVEERPQSDFSSPGRSKTALEKLLLNLAESETTVIFTFPDGECSNGLSGEVVLDSAKKHFKIEKKIVKGKFSTLGGNKLKRAPRVESRELVMLMRSKY